MIDRAGVSVTARTPQPDALVTALTAAGGLVQRQGDGSLSVTHLDAARVGELAAANGIVLHQLTPEHASLEEAFMALTKDDVEFGAGK